MGKVRKSVWMLLVTAAISAAVLMMPALVMGMLPSEIPVRVSLTEVRRGDICSITALRGALRYAQEYAAIAPVTGIIAEVYVSPGEQVRKGQALARMDSTVQVAAISDAYAAKTDAWLPEGFDSSRITDAAVRENAALLEAMTLRAAADGMVIEIPAGKYSGVTAGSPAVLLCSGTQRIVCMAAVSDAAELSPGMYADVIVRGEMYCTATVEHIGAAQTDAQTGQTVCAVKLRPEQEISLPVGALLETEITRCRYENVTVLPLTAISDNGTFWTVSDGRCWETDAEIIGQDAMYCWVNLPEGTVVIDCPDGLTEGRRVREVTE